MKEKLEAMIERLDLLNKEIGDTIPFHAADKAPEFAARLVSIRLQCHREFLTGDKVIECKIDEASERLNDLITYYQGYFVKIPAASLGGRYDVNVTMIKQN